MPNASNRSARVTGTGPDRRPRWPRASATNRAILLGERLLLGVGQVRTLAVASLVGLDEVRMGPAQPFEIVVAQTGTQMEQQPGHARRSGADRRPHHRSDLVVAVEQYGQNRAHQNTARHAGGVQPGTRRDALSRRRSARLAGPPDGFVERADGKVGLCPHVLGGGREAPGAAREECRFGENS